MQQSCWTGVPAEAMTLVVQMLKKRQEERIRLEDMIANNKWLNS